MTARAVEATAPTRIDLAGGTLDIWPLYLFHPGAVTVNVRHRPPGLVPRRDRRTTGVRIESKDTLRKAEGRDVSEVLGAASCRWSPTSCARWHRDRRQGRRRSRACPPAPAWAAPRPWPWRWRPPPRAAFGPQARRRTRCGRWCATPRPRPSACPPGVQDYLAAIHGGVLGIHLEPGALRVEKLATDPARVEECLLLVDSGVTPLLGHQQLGGLQGPDRRQRERARVASARSSPRPRGVREALVERPLRRRGRVHGRGDGRRASAWPRASRTPEIDRIAEAAALGGRRGQGLRRGRGRHGLGVGRSRAARAGVEAALQAGGLQAGAVPARPARPRGRLSAA